MSLCTCGVLGLLLFGGLAIVYFITFSTVCLVTKEILLISWFLSMFVHLQLSVLVGVCLVKNSNGVLCSKKAGSTA